MPSKILEMQEKLRESGYYATEELSKILLLFEAAGKRGGRIPALFLEGPSGAGKTFLGESFAKMTGANELIVQCFPRMGSENFQYDVNIEGVLMNDPENVTKDGILLQAINQSHKGTTVVIIDELDKARPEVDSFLLDFLENGRLTTGTDTYQRGNFPIYVFITSNGKREIDEALINRSRQLNIPRPNKELFLDILSLPQDHYLGLVYECCDSFSIRQAIQYLEDLEVLGVEYDEEALSQYLPDDIEVNSIGEMQRWSNLNVDGVEIDIPELEPFVLNLAELNSSLEEIWASLLSNSDVHFDLIELNRKKDYYGRLITNIGVEIRTIEQLKVASSYGIKDFGYSGWFEYKMSEEEMRSKNIIWTSNRDKKSRTVFGVKVVGDKIYEIVMSKGFTFVYLNEQKGNTLENFLGEEREEPGDGDRAEEVMNSFGLDEDY